MNTKFPVNLKKNIHSKFETNWILLVLFVIIVFGNALTFSILGIGIKVSEILLILTAIVWLNKIFYRNMPKVITYLGLWVLLSLILIIFNSLINAYSLAEVMTGLLYLFRYSFTIYMMYVFAAKITKTKCRECILEYLNFFYIVSIILGFIILALYPTAYDFYKILWNMGVYWPDADYHIGRLFSLYLDPNYYGCCLCIGISINIYLISQEKSNKHHNILLWVFMGIYLIALALTRSRSGFLCAAITIILFFFVAFIKSNSRERALRLFISLVFILAIGSYLINYSNFGIFVRLRSGLSDNSSQARFRSFHKGWETIKDTMFIGTGYNMIGAYFLDKYNYIAQSTGNGLDSSLLLVLATTGISGTIIYALNYIYFFRSKAIPIIFKTFLCGSIIAATFNNLLFFTLWLAPTFFILFVFICSEKEVIEYPSIQHLL